MLEQITSTLEYEIAETETRKIIRIQLSENGYASVLFVDVSADYQLAENEYAVTTLAPGILQTVFV